MRLGGHFRHYAVAIAASHPCGILPLQRMLADVAGWLLLLGGVFPRDNENFLFFILDGDNLAQGFPRRVLVPIG